MDRDLVTRFEDFLVHEKHFSSNTVQAYMRDVRAFLQFFDIEVATVGTLKALTRQEVKMWIYDLVQAKQNTNTIKRKIASLNRFYKYVCKWEDLNKNIFSGLVPPKASKEVVRPFTQDEIQNLYALDIEDTDAKDMTILLLNTGLRVSELVSITLQDLDIGEQMLRIMGKGSKERLVPLQPFIVQLLSKRVESQTHYLFEKDGKPYTRFQVYHRIRKVMSQASTKDKIYTHLTRHTFATQLLDHGADIIHVKELLGHESLAATQHYAHSDLSKLKRAHLKAHPRNH